MSAMIGPVAPGNRLLDEAAMARTLRRLAHEVHERHPHLGTVVLAGVRTRGVPMAVRLAGVLGEIAGTPPAVAALELGDYRDDRPRPLPVLPVALTAVDAGPVPAIAGRTVIVVDDVLFTGRTLRCALDALSDAGRASAVELLVIIDRGHRELPVRATYVGKNVPTSAAQRVRVRLRESDGVDGAWLEQL
jgi:pyrimidine operon attenuation protein/uracil phosphoribosyltransferase